MHLMMIRNHICQRFVSFLYMFVNTELHTTVIELLRGAVLGFSTSCTDRRNNSVMELVIVGLMV